jgi:hypothetical protein
MGTEPSLSGPQQTLALCEDALYAPMYRFAPRTKDTNAPSGLDRVTQYRRYV